MTLGHSRHGYEEAVWDQKLETFLRLHERAFRDLGGVPTVVRSDNLKAAVVRACLFDPDSQDVYLAFAAHWGFTPLPTQPRRPEENGKQERSGGYVKDNALKGRRFDSLDAQNAFLRHWNRTVARLRIHGTTRRQVWTHFVEVEQRALHPLASEAFPLFASGERTVHTDGHVEVAGAFYPVPLALLGQRVRVRWDAHLVRIFDGDTLVMVHARVAAGVFAPRHSPHSRHPRPDPTTSTGAHLGGRDRGTHAPALSLSDHPPARRAHAGASRPVARHRRPRHSSDDPVHVGGFLTMNAQLTTRLRHLRLSGMVDALPGRVAQAEAAPLPHLEFLELLVEDELARRADRLFARRLKQAGITVMKALADFDWSFNPKIPKAKSQRAVCPGP
jgi:hypothetical protein